MQLISQVATWTTCNQSANLQPSRSGSPCNQSVDNQPNRTGGALQPLSEASTGCGNGLQLISDSSTAIAEIAGISPFRAVCQRFLSRFCLDSSFRFHHIFLANSRKICQLTSQSQPLVGDCLFLARQFFYILLSYFR
jgi:hypothetical protein